MNMIDENTIEKLRDLYQSMPKVNVPNVGDGWVNQYEYLKAIEAGGIDFREFGYERYYDFLKDTGIFRFWTDYTGNRRMRYLIEKSAVGHEEVNEIKKHLRLENTQFIGQFSPSTTAGWFTINDIRDTDFTKIEDKERGIKNPSISFRCFDKTFNRYAYYKFTWVLLGSSPIKFGIDLHAEITPLYPKQIVLHLHDGIMRYPAGAANKIARSLDTLKKQLTQSGKEVFIYELLQNANDYPRHDRINGKTRTLPVEVEFYITDNYLIFQHTGDYFNPRNIAAICDINGGEKADNTEAIGYKGIGFKTVFLDNDYVLLNTGNYSFRFDKAATDVINTPWQILPIWTESGEIDEDVKSVFARHPNSEFRVKFALQPRDKKILSDESRGDNYIDLFDRVFDSERVILFIPNIKKVSIFVTGQNEPIIREKDNNNWSVSDALVDDIPEEITEKINEVLANPNSHRSDGYEKIPEKYINFHKTTVKFACRKNGRRLAPVEDATLYCYLPAKRADWGFPFLMNTDMVPNGQRDDIEDIELNHVITRIAGRQFFYWIKQLIEYGEYNLDSIFSLIPDFDECKKRRIYKAFIEEFQEEFERLTKNEPFVPVIDKNGRRSIKCIHEIINDMTGMTADGVMSDADFITLMKLDDYCLPIDELRKSESFKDFLYKHSPSDLDIKVGNIADKCEDEEFQKWMSDLDNNTRFIEHWMGREEVDKFIGKRIFIEYEGELWRASDLYYDFDANCAGLESLRRFIPHLSPESKERLMTYDKWSEFAGKYFCEFSATEMVRKHILRNEKALEAIELPENSKAFFRYLAEEGIMPTEDDYKKLPYIVEGGNVCRDYEHYQYFYNESSYALTQESWIGENTINVLSHIYFDEVEGEKKDRLIKLFKHFGFEEFDKDSFVVNTIIGDEDFRANVNVAITDNYPANKAFVDYVYSINAQLKENCLKNYVLRCVDITGNEVYLCNDDVRYFDQEAYSQNSTYKDNIGHAWLKKDMMYALSNAYFEPYEKEETKDLQSFLRQQFGVRTFTDKSFFLDVVVKNRADIYDGLVDGITMSTFLDYLKRDAERIFDDTLSFNDIRDMPLLCYDSTVIRKREPDVQYVEFDEEARVLCEKLWCPKAYVLLDQRYTDDFSQDMRQLFKITKFDINAAIDIIVQSPSLKQSISAKEQNVDFWRWIKTIQRRITSFDKLKLLPLIDQNNASATSELLYISDLYQQDKIESLVSRYVPVAQFVSSAYLESDFEDERSDWMRLFKKLGLKSGNRDILFSDILPNISSFEEDSVVAMMTKYLKDLKENWAGKRDQIIQLRVRARSGKYKTLDQLVIVNVDEESVAEPFKYIVLSNEVDPSILKNNKELLLLISKEFDNHNLITDKQMWIESKVKDYLRRFTDNPDSVADVHFQFVRELANLQGDYTINDTILKQIKYRAKSPEKTYMYAHEMTLGSAFSPTCDFEGHGVTELHYLSEEYITKDNRDVIKSYFKGEDIHQDMTRDDLTYLGNRTFACYFWSDCFSRRLSEYKEWIESGYFNGIACIPTESSVKKPEQLYEPHTVASYAVRAKVSQWEEKIPFKEIVDSINDGKARESFEKLNFLRALTFEDCLSYLERANHKREEESDYQRHVIDWMLSAPIHDENLVDAYRKSTNALWRNGKGQKKHISELYTIHPDATGLRNVFWGNEFVMQTSTFPYKTDEFVQVCKILKIKCLTKADFTFTPKGKMDETANMLKILRPRLLVLSAIEDSDNFQKLYERYNERLSQLHFFKCEQIDLGYNEIHSDVERIYSENNHFFYVDSWKHIRTYTKFCSQLKKLIGFNVYDNVCEDVLDDSNPVDFHVEKYCKSLVYNDKFREYLQALGATMNVEEEEEEENEMPKEGGYYSTPHGEIYDNEGELHGGTSATGHPTSTPTNAQWATPQHSSSTQPTTSTPVQSMGNEPEVKHGDEYAQVDDDDDDASAPTSSRTPETPTPSSDIGVRKYNPDGSGYMGQVTGDKNYQPLGDRPVKPLARKHPKPFIKEELERLRSQGTPLELESLPETKEEIDLLAQCDIQPEQIADTNYLAQLRLYQNLRESGEEPEETFEEFVHNADDVAVHKMKNGKYIHSCSAARGVMYISPSVWNKMVDNQWQICVYLDGRGKNFHYINDKEEFLKLVEKDDVVIKITGKEKVEVVKALYSGLLKDVKGTAYTLIRVASSTNMDAVFAHYVGAMAEADDGNEDINEY